MRIAPLLVAMKQRVDVLMADALWAIDFGPAGDLLRAPAFAQFRDDPLPCFWVLTSTLLICAPRAQTNGDLRLCVRPDFASALFFRRSSCDVLIEFLLAPEPIDADIEEAITRGDGLRVSAQLTRDRRLVLAELSRNFRDRQLLPLQLGNEKPIACRELLETPLPHGETLSWSLRARTSHRCNWNLNSSLHLESEAAKPAKQRRPHTHGRGTSPKTRRTQGRGGTAPPVAPLAPLLSSPHLVSASERMREPKARPLGARHRRKAQRCRPERVRSPPDHPLAGLS